MATTISNGRKTIATTAAALATSTSEATWVLLRSLRSNAEVAIGDSSVTLANGYLILPGEMLRLITCDLADLYVIGTAGDTLHWIAGHGTA